jgi:hypothetical protein
MIDSFQYYMSVEDAERSALVRDELLARIRGERRPPNKAMQRGIDFENDVVLAMDGKYKPDKIDKYAECVAEVALVVEGASCQVPVEANIDGIKIFGFIDFLKRNWVIDTKTTKKYDVGKYLHNNQHLAYLTCLHDSGINNFMYLVTNFSTVFKETYQWKPSFRDDLKSNIARFFDYLETDKEMGTAFNEKMKRENNG